MTEKTLQEIMDEQRELSKVHKLTAKEIGFAYISQANTGRKQTDEHKLKNSLANKGREGKSPSIETRAKIGAWGKGRISPMKDKITPDEVREKQSIAALKRGAHNGYKDHGKKVTKYFLHTPKGIFESRAEMLEAYKDEYSADALYRKLRIGKDGFSRILKEKPNE